VTKETPALTQTQINVLYTRGLVDHATWANALRALRGEATTHLGQRAIQACELAIESLVERAVDAACAVIQARLGVQTGDLAAAVLSDGAIERELTRYVHAELTADSEEPAAPATVGDAPTTDSATVGDEPTAAGDEPSETAALRSEEPTP
jgi:hypothetical protein